MEKERDGESVCGNLLRSIQSAIDFFDLLAGLGKRRMDGAGVCCRYFGLGDDRPYFHPPAPLGPLSLFLLLSLAFVQSAYVYIDIYIRIYVYT